jgi:hypothetical protein
MTDGVFSLSPPGSFPLSANPAFQDEVRSELDRLIQRVRECAVAPCIEGILLTGSFARGEGTVLSHPQTRSRWLSDVECLVVVRGGVASRRDIKRAMKHVVQDTNSVPCSATRGIKVELRAILQEGMLGLPEAIFTRELCEHGKLLWGNPAAIPFPPVSLRAEGISKADAFRLLNNRIIEQIAVRSGYADGTRDLADVAYSLVKFWIDLGTSLSIFLGCYRPGYRSRQKPVEEALCASPTILGPGIGERLASRFRTAMAQKFGEMALPSGDLRPEFGEAVEIARATWNWESGRMLGTDAAASDWRAIFTRLGSLESAVQRVRDWARVFRRPYGLRELGPRAIFAAASVGSLATLIYGTGCVIDFFWDEIGSDQGCGREVATELCRALAVRANDPSERRRLLTRATLGAWEKHLRFATA